MDNQELLKQIVESFEREGRKSGFTIVRHEMTAADAIRTFKTDVSDSTAGTLAVLEIGTEYEVPSGVRKLHVGDVVISEERITIFLKEFFGDRLSQPYNLVTFRDDDGNNLEKRVWDLDLSEPKTEEPLECLREIASVVS